MKYAFFDPMIDNVIENDTAFSAQARHDAETTMKKLQIPYQISLYGSVSHGFGVRANVSNKREKFAKEEAYLQAVRWFDTWLKE
jgi:dienelactone hydrolase